MSFLHEPVVYTGVRCDASYFDLPRCGETFEFLEATTSSSEALTRVEKEGWKKIWPGANLFVCPSCREKMKEKQK